MFNFYCLLFFSLVVLATLVINIKSLVTTSYSLIYASVLSFNILYIQSIGSGLGILRPYFILTIKYVILLCTFMVVNNISVEINYISICFLPIFKKTSILKFNKSINFYKVSSLLAISITVLIYIKFLLTLLKEGKNFFWFNKIYI